MDDVTFAAKRASAGAARHEVDVETRFKSLVQSPLRAGIVRFMFARPTEVFDTEHIMQTFGRMRLDVENCIKELVDFGILRKHAGDPPTYVAARPNEENVATLLDTFLEGRAYLGAEEASPSVQRFREMIGRDEKMLAIFEWIRTAAKSDISVLILGPTGSGKEVVARMIHELSRRSKENFQAVNCAALPDTLFESEIFGYEKGAFTGAQDRKPGRLELANGGTLFLDEVGDMSLMAQAKVLRVLEEKRFERLGGNRSIHVDFRLISATNRPLDMFVRESRFREDLYYRINAFAIRLPSLRERAVDIPVLAQPLSRALLRGERPAARREAVFAGGPGPDGVVPLAGQHPRAREHGLARGAVGAGPIDPRRRHRVPPRPRDAARRGGAFDAHALAARRRARAHHPRAGGRRVEQARGRQDPRHQPRHAVPQDRRIRPGTERRHRPARSRVPKRYADPPSRR